MVQKNGKAVLIDFGIAGEIMPQDGYFTSHHPANIAFAPYEQMGGNRQVTIDVYTLAASLYYAVTSKRAESSLDRKLYNKPLIPPNKFVFSISDELNLAILKGMNLEAEYRPQSMREWLKLLPNVSNQVYRVSQKIEHQTIKTEKTFPVIVGANNSQNIKVNSKNIPLIWVKFISLHLTIGFLLTYLNHYYIVHQSLALLSVLLSFINLIIALASHLPLALVLVLTLPISVVFTFVICFLLVSSYTFSYIFVALWIVIFFIIQFYLVNVYRELHKYLNQYSSKDYKFLLLMGTSLGTSSLGLFLGWLIYQIFPIFANR